MSHYSVIAQVSQQLQTTLWDSFRTDNEITQYVSGPESIVFSNPTHADGNVTPRPAPGSSTLRHGDRVLRPPDRLSELESNP